MQDESSESIHEQHSPSPSTTASITPPTATPEPQTANMPSPILSQGSVITSVGMNPFPLSLMGGGGPLMTSSPINPLRAMHHPYLGGRVPWYMVPGQSHHYQYF